MQTRERTIVSESSVRYVREIYPFVPRSRRTVAEHDRIFTIRPFRDHRFFSTERVGEECNGGRAIRLRVQSERTR